MERGRSSHRMHSSRRAESEWQERDVREPEACPRVSGREREAEGRAWCGCRVGANQQSPDAILYAVADRALI